MTCKECKYFNLDGDHDYGVPPHPGFGFCKKLNIHEGEMYDADYKRNIPDETINMVIFTSEWFQYLSVNKNFSCILFEQK